MDRITLALAPEPHQTRILMMRGHNELLKGILAPASLAHPRAAATLLEGLALWQQKRLCVALSVDDQAAAYALELCDQLGYGVGNVHYDVSIVMQDLRGSRRRRIEGFGHFRALQKLCLERGLI